MLIHVLCEPEQHTAPPGRDRRKRTVGILMLLYSTSEKKKISMLTVLFLLSLPDENALKIPAFLELLGPHSLRYFLHSKDV